MRRNQWMRPFSSVAILVLGAAAVIAAPHRGAGFAKGSIQKPEPRGVRRLLENDRVQVLEAIIPPGEEAGVHTHSQPTVIVVVEGATIRETLSDGQTRTEERKPGDVLWRAAGFQHNETNLGKTRLRAIAVQLK
jgi:mannose-6-phosphate isomerase-like protein (cupin superfamily)